MPSVVTAPFWDPMTGFLLDNNPVCPFHERYKDRRTAEFRPPDVQVCFRDPTGPGANPSRKDRNMFGHNFFARFAKRRPAYRHDRIRRRLTHQIGSFAREENPNFVASVRQRKSMHKGK